MVKKAEIFYELWTMCRAFRFYKVHAYLPLCSMNQKVLVPSLHWGKVFFLSTCCPRLRERGGSSMCPPSSVDMSMGMSPVL